MNGLVELLTSGADVTDILDGYEKIFEAGAKKLGKQPESKNDRILSCLTQMSGTELISTLTLVVNGLLNSACDCTDDEDDDEDYDEYDEDDEDDFDEDMEEDDEDDEMEDLLCPHCGKPLRFDDSNDEDEDEDEDDDAHCCDKIPLVCENGHRFNGCLSIALIDKD